MHTQRRNSAFFFDEKKAVVFFLENGRYRPNEQISKEKKIGHREKSRFLPIFPIFVFKNGDLTYTNTFYSLILSRVIFLWALLL